MQTIKWLTLALLMGVSLNSCTVTKRQYTGGYHVEWKKHYLTQDNKSNEETLVVKSPIDSNFSQDKNQTALKTEIKSHEKSHVLSEFIQRTNFTVKLQEGKEIGQKLTLNLQKKMNTSRNTIHSKIEHFKERKKQVRFGEPMLRTPQEYLIGALWGFIIGLAFIGIALLFILVIEVEGLSVGGLFVYFMLIVGFACIVAVPILLLLALFSYLVG